MYLRLIAAVLLVTAVAGKGVRYDFKNGVSLKFGLGTPPQEINFLIDTLVQVRDRPQVVVSDANFFNGVFDMKASTTWHKTGVINNTGHGGTTGTDTVTLAEGITFENTNVDVIRSSRFVNDNGWISMATANGESFIERALKAISGDQTVIFAFLDARSYFHSGSVTLGDANPSTCKTEWINHPALTHGNETWTIKTDEIIVGKYHAIEAVPLAFSGKYFAFSNATYFAIIRELGGKLGDDNWVHVDCDLKTEMEIISEPLLFKFTPKDYIVKWSDECRLAIHNNRGEANILPVSALHQRCIRYDFAKKEIGIADFNE